MELFVELFKGGVIKLLVIIGDDDLRQAKVIYYESLDEVTSILLSDPGEWFYLHLLGEVVDYHVMEFSLLVATEKGSRILIPH